MQLPFLFSKMDLFEDEREAEGPLQMAMDEVLLRTVERPLLRYYRWKGPWVSFGYFQKWSEIREAFPDRPLVRRWSGGGAVDHAQDWTFSLIVPSADPLRKLSAGASYCEIHERLGVALSRFFDGIQAVAAEEERFGEQCFLSPRRNDLWRNGLKVAGGAQRRSIAGLLHQGSIQNLALPFSFAPIFTSYLAKNFDFFSPSEALQKEAVKICGERYETQEWLKKA